MVHLSPLQSTFQPFFPYLALFSLVPASGLSSWGIWGKAALWCSESPQNGRWSCSPYPSERTVSSPASSIPCHSWSTGTNFCLTLEAFLEASTSTQYHFQPTTRLFLLPQSISHPYLLLPPSRRKKDSPPYAHISMHINTCRYSGGRYRWG